MSFTQARIGTNSVLKRLQRRPGLWSWAEAAGDAATWPRVLAHLLPLTTGHAGAFVPGARIHARPITQLVRQPGSQQQSGSGGGGGGASRSPLALAGAAAAAAGAGGLLLWSLHAQESEAAAAARLRAAARSAAPPAARRAVAGALAAPLLYLTTRAPAGQLLPLHELGPGFDPSVLQPW